MKMKSLFEQYMEEFSNSSTEYCFYCCTPRGDKIGCCHENHFGEFKDFEREDQVFIIENELQMVFDLEEKK